MLNCLRLQSPRPHRRLLPPRALTWVRFRPYWLRRKGNLHRLRPQRPLLMTTLVASISAHCWAEPWQPQQQRRLVSRHFLAEPRSQPHQSLKLLPSSRHQLPRLLRPQKIHLSLWSRR